MISLICREFNVNEEWLLTGEGEIFIEMLPEDEYSAAAEHSRDGDKLLCRRLLSIALVKSRVLENENITIYGVSKGLLSYQSTMGGTITIPSVQVDKIDQ